MSTVSWPNEVGLIKLMLEARDAGIRPEELWTFSALETLWNSSKIVPEVLLDTRRREALHKRARIYSIAITALYTFRNSCPDGNLRALLMRAGLVTDAGEWKDPPLIGG